MIKRMTMLVRKDGTTRARFREYWREHHAKIVVQMPSIAGYVQNPITDHLYEDIGERPAYDFDGLVELWFANADAQQQAFASPAAKQLPPDEHNFIKGITILTIEEAVLRTGNEVAVKAMLVLNVGSETDAGRRRAMLSEIEKTLADVPEFNRLLSNRVVESGIRAGLWSEPDSPDAIVEIGATSMESLHSGLCGSAFSGVRDRIGSLRGRLAIRVVEPHRVV